MRLHEIYQTPDDDWAGSNERSTDLSKAARDRVRSARATSNHKYVGAGGYAYVGTDDDENFGDVHRVANADDGGSLYLKYIADHPEIMENPFFPKVRQIAEYDYDENYQVTIAERLIPFETPAIGKNARLMRAIWTRYFEDPWTVAVKNNFNEWITEELRMALVNGPDGIIKDETLREAVWLLIKIKNYLRTGVDIHTGNVMWRPHPYQPQLVFTDPFIF